MSQVDFHVQVQGMVSQDTFRLAQGSMYQYYNRSGCYLRIGKLGWSNYA